MAGSGAAFEDMEEYRAIAGFYGERCAARSGQPYMKHIDEGLAILRRLGASERAQRAFCLHPLVQADADLIATFERLHEVTRDARVIALAMEYRRVANAYLSVREDVTARDVELSPLSEVNDMLRADKIQNYRDFLRYHRDTHPRAAALDRYFRTWLERLGITGAALRDHLDALPPQ